jgi:hypothetical protein
LGSGGAVPERHHQRPRAVATRAGEPGPRAVSCAGMRLRRVGAGGRQRGTPIDRGGAEAEARAARRFGLRVADAIRSREGRPPNALPMARIPKQTWGPWLPVRAFPPARSAEGSETTRVAAGGRQCGVTISRAARRPRVPMAVR